MTVPKSASPLTTPVVEPALAAFKANRPFRLETRITNEDRTLGARLLGNWHFSRRRIRRRSAPDSPFKTHGVAGQSFGAFC